MALEKQGAILSFKMSDDDRRIINVNIAWKNKILIVSKKTKIPKGTVSKYITKFIAPIAKDVFMKSGSDKLFMDFIKKIVKDAKK